MHILFILSIFCKRLCVQILALLISLLISHSNSSTIFFKVFLGVESVTIFGVLFLQYSFISSALASFNNFILAASLEFSDSNYKIKDLQKIRKIL